MGHPDSSAPLSGCHTAGRIVGEARHRDKDANASLGTGADVAAVAAVGNAQRQAPEIILQALLLTAFAIVE